MRRAAGKWVVNTGARARNLSVQCCARARDAVDIVLKRGGARAPGEVFEGACTRYRMKFWSRALNALWVGLRFGYSFLLDIAWRIILFV